MLDFDALADSLRKLQLSHWTAEIMPLVRDRMSGRTHGDWAQWSAIVEALPGARGDTEKLRELLMGLHPWRKGPLVLGGVEIDTE